MRRVKKCHTTTDIVGAAYYEQKVVFDRERGDARPLEVRAKAAAGTFEHLRFQVEGQTCVAIDRRCFIATVTYGPDAAETGFLRAWCDRVLVPATVERLFVRAYYVVSLGLVSLLCRSRCAVTAVRAGLSALLRLLEMLR